MSACLGEVADVGGQWRFQAGDPALPIFFFNDDDILVSLDREKQPFPGLDATFNGITGSYPDPEMQWEPNNAPPIYNSVWEAKDSNRRLVVNKDFPAVPYPAQVQRNMRALIADDRRFLTHGLPFPPEATVLEPLDTAAWTSVANGYSGKTFEIGKTTENLRSGVVQVTLRERDPADTAVIGGYYSGVFVPSAVPVVPGALVVPSLVVVGLSLLGSGGIARRPALQITWDGTDLPGVTGIEFEVRLLASGALVKRSTIADVASGVMLVSDGLIANTQYEVRARLIAPAISSLWSSWIAAFTPVITAIALVGGSLQSTDFVAGSAGWRIREGGNAEFNDLVVRSWLKDGAVSDQIQTVALGPYLRSDIASGAVVATLDMGAIASGSIWRIGVHFFARRGSSGLTDAQFGIESRNKILGGAFSSWINRAGFTVDQGEYEQYTWNSGLAGTYDDYEYRLVCGVNGDGLASFEFLKTVYMTAVLVTK